VQIGYIRITKAGPDEVTQLDALRAAGLAAPGAGTLYVDREGKRPKPGADPAPQRTVAIKALRPGDQLVVESAARLGATRADVLRVLSDVGAAEASVLDATTGALARWHPDALGAIAMAERAESQGQRERAAKARGRRAELGITAGPRPSLTGETLQSARAAWEDPALSAAAVAAQFDCGVRTLYRRFGAKGTPRFGGRNA
jgi:DNA invertase Pin-like site-specific DNA recombinase